MWKKDTLDNGVRVVTEEVPYAHSAVIGIWVRTGSRNEDETNHGISHFIEHLLFKGTSKRTAKQIAEELETVGGSLNAFTTKEYTCYYAKVLAEHLDLAIDLLSDMFFNSTFLEEDIEKEKNVVLEEIKMYEDSPDELIHDLFAQTVWQNHPLGRTILGTTSSISNLTRPKIIDYYLQKYNPHNVVVAVAGKIKHEEVVDKLQGFFANWYKKVGDSKQHGPVPQSAVVLNPKDTEQVQICLGAPGLPQGDENSYALIVLNNILGGGLSSRLFQEIREERGLAYSIYSYHTAYFDSGLFTIYAGTSPNKVREVIELTLKEIAKLKKNGITAEELHRTKEQIKGNLLLSMESVSNRMSRLGRTELCYGRIISAEEIVQKTGEVTAELVYDLCNMLFKAEKFSLTAIGPFQENFDFYHILEQIGI
ncbi:M16 family metallopeptidase [Zhaonella formicivorans]|uniref:M16 family metallopeptidase n=1 Tax=Zhaonella formicivorans TaxID=2528593 RepID=UPI0010D6E49F|nr:pitrilysin family protein [Zhaonella formicivorans]